MTPLELLNLAELADRAASYIRHDNPAHARDMATAARIAREAADRELAELAREGMQVEIVSIKATLAARAA